MDEPRDRIFATGNARARRAIDPGRSMPPNLEVLFWEEDTKDLFFRPAGGTAWSRVDLAPPEGVAA